MLQLLLFTDGSVNTQSKVGYGAYLTQMVNPGSDQDVPLATLRDAVRVKRFEDTSSTKLELQTLLWAINQTITCIDGSAFTLTVYTDSQTIIGLPSRRARLEKNNYRSSKNRLLSNHELYQQFYSLTSSLNIKLVKVAGHQPLRKKDEIDWLFSVVDKASRRALRESS